MLHRLVKLVIKNLIKILEDESGIQASALIDIKKDDKNIKNYWIHPDLAGQISQWISPLFEVKLKKKAKMILKE